MWKFTNLADESVELHIEGDIVSDNDVWLYEMMGVEATSPNRFKQELAKHNGKPLTVWIDSYGGDVFAAAGIYNALMEHKGGVTVKVDGKAMSAASVIAMAGDKVLMSPLALMMIHNPLTYAEGDMHELRHVADVLDQVKDSIMNAYEIKTGRSRNKISEMMDNETWMSAKVAIKDGFADGMLYDEKDNDKPVKDFAFSKISIKNSAEHIKNRILEINKEPPDNSADTLKAKLALQLEL